MKYLILTILLILIPLSTSASIESDINKVRKENGLTTLSVNKSLVRTSAFKVNDMLFHHYFAHINPFGDGFLNVYKRFKVRWEIAGEILARGYQGKELIDAWLASPTHKDVIMGINYHNIGCYQKNGITTCHFTIDF